MKNINVINSDGIYGNGINTYDQAYFSKGEHKCFEHGNCNVITVRNHCFYQKKNPK